MKIDPISVIEEFYDPGSALYHILVEHSRKVVDKSLEIARGVAYLKPDIEFIETAAMLHDIGILKTRAEAIGCTGDAPYIQHGWIGKQLLDEMGLPPEYGLVCERHTGAGITKENIAQNRLPLPGRDMVPQSIEEKIICCADKYYSKSPKRKNDVTTTRDVIENLEGISPDHARRFLTWAREFKL